MKLKSYIMDKYAVSRALKRISFEIEERNKGFDGVCLIGIRRRGLPLAKIIADFAMQNENAVLPIGSVDITPFRDDVNSSGSINKPESFNIDFDINNKKVVLVDDVIHTGRSVRAAIDAIFSIGRPASIQLAVLIDRGHRELPIRPDYVGKNIPTSSSEIIKVCVPDIDGETSVAIYTSD